MMLLQKICFVLLPGWPVCGLAAPVAACGSLDADLRRGLTVGIGHHPKWRGVLFPDKISPTMHMLCKALPPFQE